jgi:hypothetical protein
MHNLRLMRGHFRELNKLIIEQRYPSMTIQEMLDADAECIIFSVADLKQGFFQGDLDEESRKYTCFATESNQYQFRVVPQGLKTAPAFFQRIVATALRKCRAFARNYLDDIIIFSKSKEEHAEHIRLVLEALKKAQLKINPDKCKWFQPEVKLLGYIVNGKTIRIDEGRISAIKYRPEPKNSKDVERAVGLFSYYRMFIKDFAEIAKPLYELTKKGVVFNWTQECKDAHNELIQRLITEPVLAQPRLGEPFIIYSDASVKQIGGMLCQKGEDGKERVIAYATKALHGAEENYGISDLECLAAVWLIKRFRIYVESSRFTLITDHAALLYLMSIKDYTGRLARWALYLQQFSFDIIYKKGKEHVNADAVSRPPAADQIKSVNESIAVMMLRAEDIEDQELKNCDPYDNQALMYFLKTGQFKSGTGRNQIRRIQRLAIHFNMKDNTMFYRKNTNEAYNLIQPRKEDRKSIILQAHEFGHFGAESTFNRLKPQYFWRKMIQDIELVVKMCYTYQRNNTFPALAHPARAMQITGVFDTVAFDYVFGMQQTPNGYKGICLGTDVCSNLIQVWPVNDKSEETSAKCI